MTNAPKTAVCFKKRLLSELKIKRWVDLERINDRIEKVKGKEYLYIRRFSLQMYKKLPIFRDVFG